MSEEKNVPALFKSQGDSLFPAGEKITPSEITPDASLFRVIPKNFARLADCVDHVKLDVCESKLELVVRELKDFSVLNWLVGLDTDEKKEEVLTLLATDTEGKIHCMLRFCDLTLVGHNAVFSKLEPAFGINAPKPVRHEVHLIFGTMERVNEPSV